MLTADADVVTLPPPHTKGRLSLEEAIAARRSVREFLPDPLTVEQIAQLLWAMQGVTSAAGQRSAPSAGALYPLETYVATAEGLFHYEPVENRLTRQSHDDLRPALSHAAFSQKPVSEAPAVLVIAAIYARTEVKYGRTRGPRYVHMEAGHAAENALLEAVALGLAAVPVGAFDDARVHTVLGLPTEEVALYLIPVGKGK